MTDGDGIARAQLSIEGDEEVTLDEATLKQLVDGITKELTEKGLLIEAGFMALRITTIPKSAPDVQVLEMRKAYFAGAQHLWSSMLGMLDPGVEPTELDLTRMSQIHAELEKFVAALRGDSLH